MTLPPLPPGMAYTQVDACLKLKDGEELRLNFVTQGGGFYCEFSPQGSDVVALDPSEFAALGFWAEQVCSVLDGKTV